jgi:hypothetical protein
MEVAKATPNALILIFNSQPASNSRDGFSVSSTGGAVSITNLLPMQNGIWLFALSRSITAGETLTLSYDGTVGSLADSNGNLMASFTDRLVKTW